MVRDHQQRSARIPADQVFAAFRKDGFDCTGDGFGIVQDVSATGIAMRTPMPLIRGAAVIASISVGEKTYPVRLIVRRVEDLGGGQALMGMQFAGPLEDRKPFLTAYLAAHRNLRNSPQD